MADMSSGCAEIMDSSRGGDCGFDHRLIALNGPDDYIETNALKNMSS
jgi:hypothetical protein